MTIAAHLSQMRNRVEAAQKRLQILRPDLDLAMVAREANDRAMVSRHHDALYFLEQWSSLATMLKPLPFESVHA